MLYELHGCSILYMKLAYNSVLVICHGLLKKKTRTVQSRYLLRICDLSDDVLQWRIQDFADVYAHFVLFCV